MVKIVYRRLDNLYKCISCSFKIYSFLTLSFSFSPSLSSFSFSSFFFILVFIRHKYDQHFYFDLLFPRFSSTLIFHPSSWSRCRSIIIASNLAEKQEQRIINNFIFYFSFYFYFYYNRPKQTLSNIIAKNFK